MSTNTPSKASNVPQLQPVINDFVVKFANVNGSGSASANNMYAAGQIMRRVDTNYIY